MKQLQFIVITFDALLFLCSRFFVEHLNIQSDDYS